MVDRNKVLSVDIGGASCKVGLVDEDGEVLEFKRYNTEDVRKWGAEGFLDRLQPYTEDYSIDALAMGIPATVDWDHNHVRSKCREVPWLAEVENKKILQDGLGRPILLVNDVEAHLVGEWFWGELKGYSSGVVLSLGMSMGSALLWNEVPQQGRRGSIMELEHLSLDTYGDQQDADPPGSSSYWLSGSGLRDQMEQAGEVAELSEFFSSQDPVHAEIRETFEDKLAHLLGIVVMMLDPERIVLAGGLTGSHEQWLPAVEDKMDKYVMEQFQGLPSVTLAQLREEDVIKGPAAFWDWNEERL
ncbi:MAG: ROK family protein [bacterium]